MTDLNATDYVLMAMYALGLLLLVVGAVVIVAQIRFEYRKWKAFKDIDQIVQKRGPR